MEVLATQNQQNQLPPERAQRAEATINWLFQELKNIFSGWKYSFETEADFLSAKQTWLRVLAKEKITRAQLNRGLSKAEESKSQFWPSVGLFVSWCHDEDYHALGLPNEAELIARLKSFSGYAKYDEHKFKYRSKAEYWLLSTLHNKYWNKREEDLLNAAPKALKDAVEKVKSGYEFPEIPVAIEQKIVNLPQEKTLAHIANCKAALRGQAA
nr:MAG TPA: replication protein P [Caudoviricetes sp.]